MGDLTNEEIVEAFNSYEGTGWRCRKDWRLFPGIHPGLESVTCLGLFVDLPTARSLVEGWRAIAAQVGAAPCPYIQGDHCELAEVGLRVLEQKWREAEKLAGDWKQDSNMFSRAWLRELGGKVVNKTHLIDALVLTTQDIVREREEFRQAVLRARDELITANKQIEVLSATISEKIDRETIIKMLELHYEEKVISAFEKWGIDRDEPDVSYAARQIRRRK
jgi:hypothetical protein